MTWRWWGVRTPRWAELIKLDGIKVPNGFAITTHAFQRFMGPVRAGVASDLKRLHADGYQDVTLLDRVSREIRGRIEQQPFEKSFETELEETYLKLNPVRSVGGALLRHGGGPARSELRRTTGHLP